MTTSDTSRTSSDSVSDFSKSDFSKSDSADDTRTSTWSGSPYEPLPSDSSYGDYSSPSTTYSPSVYVPPPADAEEPVAAPAGRRTKDRFVAGLVGGVLGLLLVAGGLYLIGRWGFPVYEAMTKPGGGVTDPWDVTLTALGGGLILLATLLNGWTPWATLAPGLVLTGAGVWSLVTFDGADRVATTIDSVFDRPEIVVWGVTGWVLGLGAALLGASGSAIIARAAGRRRGRPGR